MSDAPVEEITLAPVKRGRGRPRKIKTPVNVPKKKRGPKFRNRDNFEEEFNTYKRCRTCKRLTNGIEDFQSTRLKRIAKTCIKCRTSVYKSLMSKPRPCTKNTKIEVYDLLINTLCSKPAIEEVARDNPQHAHAWEDLFNICLDIR
jgi:hypothetical protein